MVQNKKKKKERKNPDLRYGIIKPPVGVNDVIHNHTTSRYCGKSVAEVISVSTNFRDEKEKQV